MILALIMAYLSSGPSSGSIIAGHLARRIEYDAPLTAETGSLTSDCSLVNSARRETSLSPMQPDIPSEDNYALLRSIRQSRFASWDGSKHLSASMERSNFPADSPLPVDPCGEVAGPSEPTPPASSRMTLFFKVLLFSTCLMLGRFLEVRRLRQFADRVRKCAEIRMIDRERTARELQDNLLQGLHGLTLRFQIIADQTPPEHATSNLIRDALTRADAMLVAGRARAGSPSVGGSDLPERLARLADDGCLGGDTKISLFVSGAPRAVGAGIAQNLAEIAHEAMMNACHHACASRVRLLLSYARKDLSLVIEDNGRGLDRAVTAPEHGGVGRMRKCAASLRGALTIQSRVGWGTTLSVGVPARHAYLHKSART